jgi:hypothetical protein
LSARCGAAIIGLVDPVWAGITAGVVSGLAGAVVSGVVTLRKVRSDLAAEYDRELRAKRLEHYSAFWPKFAETSGTKPKPLSSDDLVEFSDALRAWYFDEAGIYFSSSTMDAYNILQREIASITGKGGTLSDRDRAFVRFFASAFRTRMTEDLGTRRRPLVFARSRLSEKRRERSLYRRAEEAASEGGYAGPRAPRP